MGKENPVEQGFEKLLFASRWLLAPIYLGLVAALGLLVVVFLRELFHYLPMALEMSDEKVILLILSLIDLALAGNLLLIVIFSGYENFVSKLDLDGEVDRPDWMGKIDFSGLKIKLIASIVAISAIQLLKQFMEVGKESGVSPVELRWLIALHLTFVFSGVMMAVMDWLKARSKSCD